MVADFEFENYDDFYWLVQAETEPAYQRRGIGCAIIRNAVKYYGSVYASSAPQIEHKDYDDDDTRYLTTEGAALINSCIRKGIMRPEWLFNPFQQNDDVSLSDEDYDY